MRSRIFSFKIPIIPILKKKLRHRTDGTLAQGQTKDLTQVCPESWARNPQVVLSQLGYSLWLSPVLDSKDSGESDPVPSRKASLRGRPSTDTRAQTESGQLCPGKDTSRDCLHAGAAQLRN